MEILVVIAIIVILIAIAIPLSSNQLEKSREAADLANMRSAYAAATAEWSTSDDAGKIVTYYFDGSGVAKTNTGITGYGQSSADASTFSEDLPVSARGVPNKNGHASYIIVMMGESGVSEIVWGGAYFGLNVTSASEYQSLSYEQKLERDLLLADTIQDEFRDMTYGELYDLFVDSNGNIKSEFTKGNLGGKLCITLSYSTVASDGNITTGNSKTKIFLESVFANAGFDTSLADNETYIVNSVANTTNTIWVNLGISENDLKKLNSSSDKWNQKASTAYTYVKSGGATTPEELRDANRKNG